MDYFESLSGKMTGTAPDIWISRFIIYSRIVPQPVIIRKVRLNRGLNIIWAKDEEADAPDTIITGHSAGKTTFCRMLRYLLGENNFGKKKNTDKIREIFPEAYVAAELNIFDTRSNEHILWAVLRPIGKNRNSYCLKGATIETLLENRTNIISQENYSRILGFDNWLHRMETATIVRTDEQIKWGHLLSWCSRDQESRFQNIYGWRSPRSEHGSPPFNSPKDGPLFVMRTALGLFLSDERKAEEKIVFMSKEKDRLKKKKEDLKQEPRFRKNLYQEQIVQNLRAALKEKIPKDIPELDGAQPTLFPESLEGFVNKALKQIKDELDDIREQLDLTQDEIDDTKAGIKQIDNDIEKTSSALTLSERKSNELEPSFAWKKDRMDKNRFNECLAGLPHNECDRFNSEYNLLALSDVIDSRFLEAKKKQIQKEMDQYEEQLTIFKEERIYLTANISDLKEKRNSLYNDEADKKALLKNLQKDWLDFVQWNNIIEERSQFPELKSTIENIIDLDSRISSEEAKLSALLQKHNLNRELLSNIFSQSVRTVLAKDTYNGACKLSQKEISFQITNGPAMSGEAVETLCVLLADITCLIFNAVSNTSVLPGFLIHDSPREADLGLGIYLNFIRFIEKLHTIYGGEESCPFQYIITTTTAPPAELKDTDRVKFRLNAALEEKLLLRKDIFLASDPLNIFGS